MCDYWTWNSAFSPFWGFLFLINFNCILKKHHSMTNWDQKNHPWTSLVVQWLKFRAPNVQGGSLSISGQGRSCMPHGQKKNTHTHTHTYICIYINPVENCTMVLLVSNMVYFLYKTNACFKITSKQIRFLQKIMDVSLNVMP